MAGLLKAVSTVLLAQAQKLLGLSELGPGELAGQELLGKPADVDSKLLGLGDDANRVPTSVSAELSGVVVVVGRTASRLLGLVDLDQLALVENAHQGAIPPHGDFLAQIPSWDGVEGPTELDVVIGMDDTLGPLGSVETCSTDRQ